MRKRDEPPYDELVTVQTGPKGEVVTVGKVANVLTVLEIKKPRPFAQMRNAMTMFCNGHPLTNKQYGDEKLQRSTNGNKVHLFAFKGFGIRLYGFLKTLSGKRIFIGTHIDEDKKNQKAKKRVLDTAADRCGPYL